MSAPVTTAVNYTMSPNDETIFVSATATITLLTQGLWPDKRVWIEFTGASGTMTVQPTTGTIDGSASVSTSVQGNGFEFRFDGSAWHRLSVQQSQSKMGQASVDFGYESGQGEGDTATVTIPATWVTTGSAITVQVGAIPSTNHDYEDAVIEGIQARAVNIVPGVSFDVEAYAPSGTWGQYNLMWQALVTGRN
jgi:hypothetical protein